MNETDISRRDFLKMAAFASAGLIVPREVLPLKPTHERLSAILELYTPLSFDKAGNLMILPKHREGGVMRPVSLIPTRYSQEKSVESNLVAAVKLLVVHFDGADKEGKGGVRTAASTVNGLNGAYTSSTHWCVDEYPLNPWGDEQKGFGILQTQIASGIPDRPYQGAHVLIGINLKTGAPDVNRIKTLARFEKLGINSNLKELVEAGDNDYDKFSVGFEQVGARFSIGFPSNFPTDRQIANALSLTMAVMNQYGLRAWDVVGHQEIQEKDDPGAEFMATLRFLLGVAAIKRYVPDSLVFEGKSKEEYFEKLKQYLITLRGETAFGLWSDYIGFDDYLAGKKKP